MHSPRPTKRINRLMESGSIMDSKSVCDAMHRAIANVRNMTLASTVEKWTAENAPMHPHRSSNTGYFGEIFCEQHADCPRSISHPSMGMLYWVLMGVLQVGQKLLGKDRLIFGGVSTSGFGQPLLSNHSLISTIQFRS